jgi:hypothetical protein
MGVRQPVLKLALPSRRPVVYGARHSDGIAATRLGVTHVTTREDDATRPLSGQALAPHLGEQPAIDSIAPRSRRSLLTGGAVALGGALAASLGAALPAQAASAVVLGAANTETTETSIRNTAASASAKAFVGRTSFAGTTAIQGIAEGSNGFGIVGTANVGANAVGVNANATQGIGVRANGVHGVYATGAHQGV